MANRKWFRCAQDLYQAFGSGSIPNGTQGTIYVSEDQKVSPVQGY